MPFFLALLLSVIAAVVMFALTYMWIIGHAWGGHNIVGNPFAWRQLKRDLATTATSLFIGAVSGVLVYLVAVGFLHQ